MDSAVIRSGGSVYSLGYGTRSAGVIEADASMRPVVAPETLVPRWTLTPHAILACVLALPMARAQVRLPDVPPTQSPSLPGLPVDDALRDARETTDSALRGVNDYTRRVDALLRSQRRRVDVTPAGDAMRRSEYLALDASEEALARARAAGFEVVRHEADAFAPSIAQLRDARARSPARGMRALREAMPAATIEYHHLYLAAGLAASADATATPAATPSRLRVGLVDGGVDAGSAGLSRVSVRRHGCDGRVVPQRHGTQVASRLAAGASGELFAADVWCGTRAGGDTLGVIDALRWLARERVPVINLSLVGPDNAALKRTVDALTSRGFVLVAAAGNDGPAAPPRYPAAYPAVIAVGALDARQRPLPESASGAHLDFCADGVVGRDARGTSFAAPIVANAIARQLVDATAPSPARAAQALRMLERVAVDVASPGRDRRCGAGAIPSASASSR